MSLARRSSCRSPRAGPPRRSRGVASSILRKWEGFGWCSGVITKANDDLRRSIGGDKVNLFAHYEIDGEDENDVPHVLYTCSSSTSTGLPDDGRRRSTVPASQLRQLAGYNLGDPPSLKSEFTTGFPV